jgi:heptosyltransferase III
MSLALERMAALGNAARHLPRRLPQLIGRLARPNPELMAWCESVCAADRLPVVLCRIERLGDIVAATPVAGHLRRTLGPNARIAWVCAAEYIGLLQDNPDIGAVFVEPCLTTWLMVRRRLAPQTLVVELFLDSDRCCWTGLRVKQKKSGWSIHNYYCNGNSLLAAYSGAAGYAVPDLAPQLPHFARLREMRTTLSGTNRPRIAIHFSSRDSARSWPAENVQAFCAAALAAGYELVELGNERLMAMQPAPLACLPPGSEIADHVSALATADCFVGVDSGFAHCANALGIPSLILLASFRCFTGYFPFSGPHARGPLWRCLRKEGTLAQLTPSEVIMALANLLNNIPSGERSRICDTQYSSPDNAKPRQSI